MINEIVVIDTGPLVALLRHDDQCHELCRDVLSEIRPPLLTTWPVITEAAWLLRNIHLGVQTLLELVQSDLIQCIHLDEDATVWLKAYLNEYSDLRLQLADASLAYVAERVKTDLVFTLDRRDFVVIRQTGGKPFRLLPEAL
jgi:predicted nucleic acid-binding protein